MLDGNEKLHPCSGLLSEHTLLASLVKTNAPIYGVLMQPYSGSSSKKAFIMVQHVKFLQSGGARVVPVDYRSSKTSLQNLLG